MPADELKGIDGSAGAPPDWLRHGDLSIIGRMPFSSNATFLVEVCYRGSLHKAVYKPGRGERPLRDFPPDLFVREEASYQLALALGWRLVPPTVLRDGPLGAGSLQCFVEADFSQHYFTLASSERFGPQLRRVCLFDLIANSADRKAGHVLVDSDDKIWAIDNGLTFHSQLKLRTVIWDFAGERISPGDLADVRRLVDRGPPDALAGLITAEETEALMRRAEAVARTGIFPHDPTGQRWPWPVV